MLRLILYGTALVGGGLWAGCGDYLSAVHFGGRWRVDRGRGIGNEARICSSAARRLVIKESRLNLRRWYRRP